MKFSNIDVQGNITPDTSGSQNIGSLILPFQNIYISDDGLFMGSHQLSIDIDGFLTVDGSNSVNLDNYATITLVADISAGLDTRITTNETNISSLQTNTSGITGGLTQTDNRYVNVTGDTMTGTLNVEGIIRAEPPNGTTDDAQIEIGVNRSGDGNAYIDLVGDTVYTAYGLRLIRNDGENADSQILHRGGGDIHIRAQDSGDILFQTGGANTRFSVTNSAVTTNVQILSNSGYTFTGINSSTDRIVRVNSSGTDFSVIDNSLPSGIWAYETGTPADSGGPVNARGAMLHTRRAAGGGETQFFVGETNGRLYSRGRVTGAWTDWLVIPYTNDIDANNIPRVTSSGTFTNSIINQSTGGDIFVGGDTTINGTLSVSGAGANDAIISLYTGGNTWALEHDQSASSRLDFNYNSSAQAALFPTGELQLYGNGILSLSPSTTDAIIRLNSTGGGGNEWRIYSDIGTDNLIVRDQTGSRNIAFFNTNGQVTIGTGTQPSGLVVDVSGANTDILRLQADMGVNDRNLTIKSPSTDSINDPFVFSTGNSIAFEIDSQIEFLVDQNGSVTIGSGNTTESRFLTVNASGAASDATINLVNQHATWTIFNDASAGGNLKISNNVFGNFIEFDSDSGGVVIAEDLRVIDDIFLNTNNSSGIFGRDSGGSLQQIAFINSSDQLLLGDYDLFDIRYNIGNQHRFFINSQEIMTIDESTGVTIGNGTGSTFLTVDRAGTDAILAQFQVDMGTNDRNLIIRGPTTDSASEPFRLVTGNSLAVELDAQIEFLVDATGNAVIGSGNTTESRSLTINASGANSDSSIFLTTQSGTWKIYNQDVVGGNLKFDWDGTTVINVNESNFQTTFSGALEVNGDIEISEISPSLVLTETDGSSGAEQINITLNGDSFNIQTRQEDGTFVSNDYLMPRDANGATSHTWRVGNSERFTLDTNTATFLTDVTIADNAGITTLTVGDAANNAAGVVNIIGGDGTLGADAVLQLTTNSGNWTILNDESGANGIDFRWNGATVIGTSTGGSMSLNGNLTVGDGTSLARVTVHGASGSDDAILQLETDTYNWEILSDESGGLLRFRQGGVTRAQIGSEGGLTIFGAGLRVNELASAQDNIISVSSNGTLTDTGVAVADVTGSGGGGGARTVLATYTPTSVLSVDITDVFTDTYDQYVIRGYLVPANDGVGLRSYLSTNNGSTWITSGGSYQRQEIDANGSSVAGGQANDADMNIGDASIVGSDTGEYIEFNIRVTRPTDSNLFTLVSAQYTIVRSFGDIVQGIFCHKRNVAEDNNAMQILFDSGNIESGRIVVEGLNLV